MHNEVAAAASYLSSLLLIPNHATPPPTASLDAFKATVCDALCSAYSNKWHAQDPEKGSGARALHWQPGPGGEGCSLLVTAACKRHGLTVAAGQQWTLWVDPSCVALRLGPGPGRNGAANLIGGASASEGFKVIYGSLPLPKTAAGYSHVTVNTSPTVSFARATSRAAIISRPLPATNRVPSVTVSPSTPALDRVADSADVTPVVPWNAQFALGHHLGIRRARRSSSASTSSSATSSNSSSRDSLASGGRQSLEASSSIGTSLPASSPPATWDKLDNEASADADEKNNSVALSPASSTPLSLKNVDLLGLGLEDCGLDEADAIAPEDAVSVADVEQDDEERDGEGDDTIRSLNEADETICPAGTEEKITAAAIASLPVATNVQQRPRVQHSRSSSTVSSASSSVTSFDNGNVGVLGGGVKLGGASTASSSGASGNRRSRAMSGASSMSSSSRSARQTQHSRTLSRTGGWAAQQQQQVQQQAYFQHQQPAVNALGMANMIQQPYQHSQPQVFEFAPVPQQSHASVNAYPSAPPLEKVGLLKRREAGPLTVVVDEVDSAPALLDKPNDTGKLGSLSPLSPTTSLPLASPALSSCTSSSFRTEDGEEDDDEEGEEEEEGDSDDKENAGKPRRTRTRGRRSRGRGAGRAARRAAAAAAAAAATAACLPPGVAALPTPPMPSTSPLPPSMAWGKPGMIRDSPHLQQFGRMSPMVGQQQHFTPPMHQHAIPARPSYGLPPPQQYQQPHFVPRPHMHHAPALPSPLMNSNAPHTRPAPAAGGWW
ncbi:hypothetical protein BDZ90DRAFT_124781 [Jaminaea rosea]|uniref:Anti-proliferative protein domain-containing protein n=1 Tax=Jaminaea rosea TaxID=1569628 RepID=A0A316UGT3_9BASI|nr:hypothetical protein BDZ90DRAFT_124781 [Jaminaea rosea]PWN24459.1 hypothetical protein BDZ90DRAFT_124781 [Jaminaea rosea]